MIAERYDSLRYNANRESDSFFFVKGRDGPTPMELGAVTNTSRSNNSYQGSSSNKPSYDKLTPEQRQQLIKEGRCFYCRETGHRALDCPKRKIQSNHSR